MRRNLYLERGKIKQQLYIRDLKIGVQSIVTHKPYAVIQLHPIVARLKGACTLLEQKIDRDMSYAAGEGRNIRMASFHHSPQPQFVPPTILFRAVLIYSLKFVSAETPFLHFSGAVSIAA